MSLSQGSFSEWSIERADEHFQRNLDFGARLLEAAPDDQATARLLQGMATGFAGKPFLAAPDGFRRALAARASVASSFAAVALRARTGDVEAQNEAVRRLSSDISAPAAQLEWLSVIRDTTPVGAGPTLESMLTGAPSELLQAAILEALGAYDHADSARRVLQLYASFPPRIQARASNLLCSSPTWAAELVRAIQAGSFDAGNLASEARAALRRQNNPVVAAWLKSGADQATTADPARRAAQQLFETGRVGFNLSCAPCHQESGEGRTGLAPSLLGSRWVGGADEPLIRILLHGKENPGRGLIMPPWRHLEDSQIAAILTYVKREFGNRDVPVPASSVGAVRSVTAERTRAWTDAELESSLRPVAVPKS